MDELISQLIDYGFENFMFISGHAGSVAPIQSVGIKYQLKKRIVLHRLIGGDSHSSTMRGFLLIKAVCVMLTRANVEHL